jgi:hypothetical protein
MPKNIYPDKCSIFGKIDLLIRVSKATDALNLEKFLKPFSQNFEKVDHINLIGITTNERTGCNQGWTNWEFTLDEERGFFRRGCNHFKARSGVKYFTFTLNSRRQMLFLTPGYIAIVYPKL